MARQAQDPQARRNEILDKAQICFLQKGYTRTTVSDLAGELKVARSMFYYYFKSKEEILEALLQRDSSAMSSAVAQMVRSADSPTDKLAALYKIILRQIYDGSKRDLTAILFMEDNRHIRQRIIEYTNQLLKPLVLQIVRQGCTEGYFSLQAEEETLQFLFFSLEYIISSYHDAEPEVFNQRVWGVERLIERLLGAKADSLHLSL